MVLVGLLVGGATLAAQAPDPAKVAAGQKVFATQKCDTCHSIAGKGGKLSTALDGVGGKVKEADIRKWLTNPADMEKTLKTKPKMPMSTYLKTHKLTDPDIDALTAYMLSLK
jgi:mono/diheme cytochrome c family protein